MRFKSLFAVIGALLLATYVASPAYAEDAKPAQGDAKSAQGATPICATCHEQPHNSTLFTAHGAKNDANGSMCQACHGDASEHLKDPVAHKPVNRIKYGTPQEKSAICLNCHQTNRHLAFWESGRHATNDVTCANCHSIHGRNKNPTIAPFQTTFRENESDMCGTCHKAIKAATLKPSHHPIVEGKVKCSDCHNPHGAIAPAMLRNPSINEQCTSCHADKRGPYVFEHPPVEENCASCHNPHGSSHYKLLNEHTPNLCQECHEGSRHPGTIYGSLGGWTDPVTGGPNAPANISTRLIARACLNCHAQVHGSNAPGSKGKFFLR